MSTRVKIKRRSKVQEKNKSRERVLNFDHWKKISENYEPMRVWLWLAYKFTKNYCRLRLFLRGHSNSRKVSYLSWQNTYPNFESTCHIKLKCFLWTKLKENLLLMKYLISVAATLIYFSMVVIGPSILGLLPLGKYLFKTKYRNAWLIC